MLFRSALFVAARAGAVAHGLLPAAPGADGSDDEDGAVDADDGRSSGERGDAPRERRWRITEDDRERMRKHLDKTRGRRSPDDLLPAEEEDAESDGP